MTKQLGKNLTVPSVCEWILPFLIPLVHSFFGSFVRLRITALLRRISTVFWRKDCWCQAKGLAKTWGTQQTTDGISTHLIRQTDWTRCSFIGGVVVSIYLLTTVYQCMLYSILITMFCLFTLVDIVVADVNFLSAASSWEGYTESRDVSCFSRASAIESLSEWMAGISWRAMTRTWPRKGRNGSSSNRRRCRLLEIDEWIAH